MEKFYTVCGILTCLLLAYANSVGWALLDGEAGWGPTGPHARGSRGHGGIFYHK